MKYVSPAELRLRTFPMPQVGDEMWVQMNGDAQAYRGKVVQVYGQDSFDIETAAGIANRTKNSDRYESGYAWGWLDPAIEAQRLQEAAWRADDSPLPEELLSAIDETKYSFKRGHERSEEILHELMFSDSGIMNLGGPDFIDISDAARVCMKHIYNLLRWQAQQEGGKP